MQQHQCHNHRPSSTQMTVWQQHDVALGVWILWYPPTKIKEEDVRRSSNTELHSCSCFRWWPLLNSFLPLFHVFSVWSVRAEISKALTLVLTRLSLSSILGQTVFCWVFLSVRMTNEPQAPACNSSGLQVIPLQAAGGLFPGSEWQQLDARCF